MISCAFHILYLHACLLQWMHMTYALLMVTERRPYRFQRSYLGGSLSAMHTWCNKVANAVSYTPVVCIIRGTN